MYLHNIYPLYTQCIPMISQIPHYVYPQSIPITHDLPVRYPFKATKGFNSTVHPGPGSWSSHPRAVHLLCALLISSGATQV